MKRTVCAAVLLLTTLLPLRADERKEGHFNSGDVKIHYVTEGKGPLIVLIHGFPDFWYTWRDQIPVLAKHFQVVALDLRGFNESDKPKGVETYALPKLVGDIEACLKHFKADKAVIVGHDWGGAVAWAFAMAKPDKTDRLIVLNCPHPRGILRELANNPEQRKASEYARNFQADDAATKVKPEQLIFWVKEKDAQEKYLAAMKKSSVEGMLNYYKANYPREPYKDEGKWEQVKCPTLVIHGLKDPFLLPGALNDTWKWVDKEVTLVTIPGASHFVHRDATEKVNQTLLRWLRD